MKTSHKNRARHNRRHAGRAAYKSLTGGNPLRVEGKEGEGFRLGIVFGGSDFFPIGPHFTKQRDAVAHGQKHHGQKASKRLRKAA